MVEATQNAKPKFLRGQAAIENLVMVGFALAFILPLAFLFMSSTGTENAKTAISQAQITARTIADAAGELYLEGSGAQKTILVNYPADVKGSSATNGVVLITITPEADRTLDIVASTFADIREGPNGFSGARGAGLQRVKLQTVYDQAEGKDYVEISYEQ